MTGAENRQAGTSGAYGAENRQSGASGASGAFDSVEAAFLAAYRLDDYPRPSVAVDVVLLSVADGALQAVLVQRSEQPALGAWALPGGFVRLAESLDSAVARVLAAKTGLGGIFTTQLATFGEVDRDPRGRVISVAYIALVAEADLPREALSTAGAIVARLERADADEAPLRVFGPDGTSLALAFDHGEILSAAVTRLRGRLWYMPDAFSLVGPEFTLLELQAVHEAVLGRPIDKNSFRRRILDSGLVEPVGRRREGLRARPAEIFRLRQTG